jgi:hypothetical protein
MTEHDQQSSGVEAAANAQPSQGRRRLVKGAIIAVPAIFTVRNGFARPNSMPPSQEEACTSFLTAGNTTTPSMQSFIAAPGNNKFNPNEIFPEGCMPPPPPPPIE